VIAADTIVVAGDRFLGKPRNAGDARDMLRSISGRRHHVVTGVAVVHRREKLRLGDSAVTAVWFRELEDDEIAKYVESGEPLDKAGAYGIQGKAAVFVDRLDGDYFNVVGLPLVKLARLLERAGVHI
jgi:septum formation protein